jgi:hypothetical protein
VTARAATLEDAAPIPGIDVSTLHRKRKRYDSRSLLRRMCALLTPAQHVAGTRFAAPIMIIPVWSVKLARWPTRWDNYMLAVLLLLTAAPRVVLGEAFAGSGDVVPGGGRSSANGKMFSGAAGLGAEAGVFVGERPLGRCASGGDGLGANRARNESVRGSLHKAQHHRCALRAMIICATETDSGE